MKNIEFDEKVEALIREMKTNSGKSYSYSILREIKNANTIYEKQQVIKIYCDLESVIDDLPGHQNCVIEDVENFLQEIWKLCDVTIVKKSKSKRIKEIKHEVDALDVQLTKLSEVVDFLLKENKKFREGNYKLVLT